MTLPDLEPLPDLSHYEQADFDSLRRAVGEFAPFLGADGVRTALDVGSRDAKIALGLAGLFPQASVYAFECNPDAVAICRRNIGAHPRVALVEKAVSDAEGDITFYAIDPERTVTPHADGNIGASSLYHANPEYPNERYAQNAVTVPGTTLAAWMAESGTDDIDVLWMDLQGAELRALRGLGEKLQRVKVIHTEVQYREMYLGAPLFDEFDAFLRGQGFVRVKQLYTSEWFGDVLYVREDLAKPETRGPSVQTKKTFVIEVPFGGLGDNLFFSHLPRIAKESGYDRVFVSNATPFRHPDYKRLIWDLNPYVDGFCDERREPPVFDAVEPGLNLLDKHMLLWGLDDGQRFHEPEIYYQPRWIPELADKSVYDPNFVSYVGDLTAPMVREYFDAFGIPVHCQMAPRDKSLPIADFDATLQTPTLEAFCDVLASCRRVYCLSSGTATLAAALRARAVVLHGPNQKPMFHHSKRHTYVPLQPKAPNFRDAVTLQVLIDREPQNVGLYAEAALACLGASDTAGAGRFYEDACELNAAHPAVAPLHACFAPGGHR